MREDVSHAAAPLLERLRIDADSWDATLRRFFSGEKLVGNFFGHVSRLHEAASTKSARTGASIRVVAEVVGLRTELSRLRLLPTVISAPVPSGSRMSTADRCRPVCPLPLERPVECPSRSKSGAANLLTRTYFRRWRFIIHLVSHL